MDGDDAGGQGYPQTWAAYGATGGNAKAANAAARNVQLAAARAKGAEEAKAKAVREAADAQVGWRQRREWRAGPCAHPPVARGGHD